MSIKADLQTWMARGDELGCFASRLEQVRYATAWDSQDEGGVLAALEGVFSRTHRMPALNWLSFPEVVESVDALEDGPGGFLEDWVDADFSVRGPGGELMSGKWLDESAWQELLASAAKEFVFLSGSDKIATARKWRDQVRDAMTARPLSLSALAEASVRARLLSLATVGSEALRVVLSDATPWLGDAADRLRARASTLVAARRAVLDPDAGEPYLLTFSALRSCKYIFQIDALLARATTPAVANLMNYLRCLDAPATSS